MLVWVRDIHEVLFNWCMTSPPVTPDQDRAGHNPSGVSFSPTAVVPHPAIVLRRKSDVRRKLMVVTHALLSWKWEEQRKEKDFIKSEYERRTIWLHHGTIHDSCVGTSIAAAIILSSSMANRLLSIEKTNVLILIFSDDDEWRAQISGWHHKTCLFCFFGEGPNFIPRGLKSTFDPPTIRDALIVWCKMQDSQHTRDIRNSG